MKSEHLGNRCDALRREMEEVLSVELALQAKGERDVRDLCAALDRYAVLCEALAGATRDLITLLEKETPRSGVGTE